MEVFDILSNIFIEINIIVRVGKYKQQHDAVFIEIYRKPCLILLPEFFKFLDNK